MVKKIALAGALLIALGAYAWWSITSPQRNSASATNATNNPSPTTTEPVSTQSTSTPYKDGTYTGSVADAFYGPLQVQIVIQGGKLTDLTYLQYPNSQPHTQQVSAMALPALKSEAIASQSATVNTVSGATQDSEAFRQTLLSALAQAQ